MARPTAPGLPVPRAAPPRLVLKVDVDTLQGTVEGVPRLLDLFARHSVLATFFFSLGPDNTGKAVKRIFRKGFVKKVLRASPAASYGLKTMLYGTLLPAPDIGRTKAAVDRMHEVRQAGHECGLHAWDHVDWHDRLPLMGRVEVEAVVRKAHERFAEIFGEPTRLSAAPGWTATPLSVEVQETFGVRVTSDTRGGGPFHPRRSDGSPSEVLEIPSTLPTLDELLADDAFGGSATARERTTERLVSLVGGGGGSHVHSIHTEIEGGKALHPLFARQLAALRAAGVRFLTLGELAAEVSREGTGVPAREIAFVRLENRATPVSQQLPG